MLYLQSLFFLLRALYRFSSVFIPSVFVGVSTPSRSSTYSNWATLFLTSVDHRISFTPK